MAKRRPRLVLKLGGELLERPDDLEQVARAIAQLSRKAALVVVHGGGKEIDAALAAAGIPKQQVDGLRVTDERTLEVVVAVVAGTINTRLVTAVRRAGGKAVGVTGVDADVPMKRARPIVTVSGETVDLGLVGAILNKGKLRLLDDLLRGGYVPVMACVGADPGGQLLNVNADTLASHVAGRLGAGRLVIAGGTPGVLDAEGRTIPRLTMRAATGLIRSGTANKGMIAKLDACRSALRLGVGDVVIASGRDTQLATLAGRAMPPEGCTQVAR